MKLALLSDLHANLQATLACVAHARAAGADQFAVLGDLVGYGGDPVAVVEQVQALVAEGAWVVQGNHDAYIAGLHSSTEGGAPGTAQSEGERGGHWTAARLSPGHRRFLASLPLVHVAEGLLLVHATADAPSRWKYATSPQIAAQSLEGATTHGADIRHVFGGHVHEQTLFFKTPVGKLMPFAPTAGISISVPAHRRWLATVGSVGQPRDGDPRAMYALFDTVKHQLIFHRVPYDHGAAAAAIRSAGQPAAYADRLAQGR